MSVNLYRLYAVQNFNGEQLAVYVNEGNFPDPEVLGDAEEIVRGEIKRKHLIQRKPWVYDSSTGLAIAELNKQTLTKFTRLLARSRELVEKHRNIDKAIFVPSTDARTWRGENTLYYNKYFDELKSDTPEFSGCTPNGTITL